MVTLQVVPELDVHPPQAPNVCPAFGVAVRVTEESAGKEPEQVDPQLMPDGALTITPSAPPVTFRDRLNVTVPWLPAPGDTVAVKVTDWP